MHSLGHADGELALMQMQHATEQHGPLDHKRGNEHVEADAAVAVLAQEGHEEAEADEDHHVHVLEHCKQSGGLL